MGFDLKTALRLISETIKRMNERKVIKDTFWFTLSNIVFQGSKFITYLYAAKLMGPKIYGLWNGLILILIYGANSHLGVLNAMNREIPYYEGAGNPEKIVEIRNLGAGIALYTSIPLAIGIFLFSFYRGFDADTMTGLRFISLLLLVQQIYVFYQMILKSHGFFLLMSIQQFYFSCLTLIIVIMFTKYYGFTGFLLGQLIVMTVIVIYVAQKISIKFKPLVKIDQALELVKIGFPIMMVGLAYGMLTTIDRIMILKYLGKEQLGYYSLSIMATGILTLLPMTIGQVVYPKMAKKYGQTRSRLALRDLIYYPTLHLSWIMALVLTVVYFGLPAVIQRFLPEYARGIDALKITVWGVYFLSLVGGFANFLNTVGLQKIYLLIQFITIVIIIGLNLVFIKLGMDITGIALATSITYVIYALMLFSVTEFALRKDGNYR